jgi:hypothetical protein
MTYDYVARVTFQAESDEDARKFKITLDSDIQRWGLAHGNLQSNLYNTSAPDMPGGVEIK